MAFTSFGQDVFQFVLEYVWRGKTVANVLGARFIDAAPVTVTRLQQTATKIQVWYDQFLAPLVSEDVSLTAIRLFGLQFPTSPSYVQPVTPPLVGGRNSGSVLNNTSLVATLQTGQRGRSFRGRFYLNGLPSIVVQGNYVAADYRTAYLQAMIALSDSLITGDPAAALCVLSRFKDGQPREVGLPTSVASVTVRPRVDTQRRRLPKE